MIYFMRLKEDYGNGRSIERAAKKARLRRVQEELFKGVEFKVPPIEEKEQKERTRDPGFISEFLESWRKKE